MAKDKDYGPSAKGGRAEGSGVPWNSQGISVSTCSLAPDRWQYSVWHANGIDMGGAATEDEAWERARAIARFHGVSLGVA